ncbi:MAG: MoaD/ThiS family protein [Verrucomicrobiota bacterium]
MAAIRVELPFHLHTLTQIAGCEVTVDVSPPVTIGSVLDAVEFQYPVLRGTIRDHGTLKRRPFLRFYVCEEDWSNLPADTALPEEVFSGKEPFAIIGAIAGG